MKRIKTLVTGILLTGILLVSAATTKVYAAFSSSVKISTKTAAVSISGGGTVSMDANIKDATAHTGAAQIGWDGVVPGTTLWRMATHYIQLDSTITASVGAIQIYTDNTNTADASPKFVLGISSNPAGLVHVQNSSNTLRMAWSIKGSTKVIESNIGAADPNTGPGSGFNNRFQWLFLKDKVTPAIPSENTTAFVNGETFVTVKDTTGIHFGQADTEFGGDPSPDFIYFEANFTTAVTPATYKTSTLRVEAFME